MSKLLIERWLQLAGVLSERLNLTDTASSGKTYADQLGGNSDNKGYIWEQSVEQALTDYLKVHPDAWYSQNVRATEAEDFTYDVGLRLGNYDRGPVNWKVIAQALKEKGPAGERDAKKSLLGTLECKFGKAQLGKIHKAFFGTDYGGTGHLKFTPNADYTGGSFDYALNLEYCKKCNWDPQVLRTLITPILDDANVQEKMAQIIKSVLDSTKWPAAVAKPMGAFDLSSGPKDAFSRPGAQITADQMKLIHKHPPVASPSTGDRSHWTGTITVAGIGASFIQFLGTTKNVILIGEGDPKECVGYAWALTQAVATRTGLPLFTAPGGSVKVMPRFKEGKTLVVETSPMSSSTPGAQFTDGESLFNLIRGLDETKVLDTFDTVSNLGAEHGVDTSPDSVFWNTDDSKAAYKDFVEKWNADPANADKKMPVVEHGKHKYSITAKLLGE